MPNDTGKGRLVNDNPVGWDVGALRRDNTVVRSLLTFFYYFTTKTSGAAV
jgi:hypothetical protein